MSEQKNPIIIAVTLALVSVFILGGISFTLFPSQLNTFTLSEKASMLSALSSKHPSVSPSGTIASVSMIWPLDSVCIESDGTINSTDVPIKRVGDTFTFTRDIVNKTILVQRDNIVIDGVGHTLQGFKRGESSYGYEGIVLDGRSNVIIKDLVLTQFDLPIFIQSGSKITVVNNTFVDNHSGVVVNSANDSTVTENNFNQTLAEAISFENSYGFSPSINNVISRNNITDATTGISTYSGSSNIITWNNLANVFIPIGAGKNTTIANNNMVNGIDGIGVSSYCNVYQNTVLNFSESAISVEGHDSIIFENYVANCSNGVLIYLSDYRPLGNNTFYHNNFVNNTEPLLLLGNASQVVNFWDNGKEGNYWSNYNGTDTKTKGIGDTPYTIGANNIDRYPLMQPYVEATTENSMQLTLFTASAVTAAAGSVALAFSIIIHKRHNKKKPTKTPN